MILICSAGHEIDTEKFSLSDNKFKKPGDKCGQLIEYSRMTGSKYCQRRLKLRPQGHRSASMNNRYQEIIQEIENIQARLRQWQPPLVRKALLSQLALHEAEVAASDYGGGGME